MGEINSAQYSSVFPRFLLSLGFHPLGEDAKSCESPWLLVETAFFTPLSVDLGFWLKVAGVHGGFCQNLEPGTRKFILLVYLRGKREDPPRRRLGHGAGSRQLPLANLMHDCNARNRTPGRPKGGLGGVPVPGGRQQKINRVAFFSSGR